MHNATPTAASATRVADKAAKRLDRRFVAFCKYCNDSVIVRLADARSTTDPLDAGHVWRHRETGATECAK